ncbi:hypothetical protein [Desulfofundulus salinus]|uniref:hypothetical protein n=1 Tax=Desulfofundulus salinus TaxID=2419843 RepID=UPI000F64D4FF|nr:hypothetical protein [Desulfofundulus salinum]
MKALNCAPGPPRRPPWSDIHMIKPHIPASPRPPSSSATAYTPRDGTRHDNVCRVTQQVLAVQGAG